MIPSLTDHRRVLWAIGYRLTGSAADADDLVQETFARALAHPPARPDEPLRPWLVRIAVNLARDQLRRRRTRGYDGPWLPAPVETDIATEPDLAPEARYGLRESATVAFLLAAEALTPHQRAVLILRDVLDYSVRQTAEALDTTEASVKQTHRRARTAMSAYDATRVRLDAAHVARTREMLERFVTAIAAQDTAAVEALLAADVRTVNDANGEYHAAVKPVFGAAKVARLYVKTASLGGRSALVPRWEIREVNGLPAIVAEYDGMPPDYAPRFVLQVDVGADGKIREVRSTLATDKLAAIAPVRAAATP